MGLGTIGVASVGAGVGTYAAFTDSEESAAILTAGALDLVVHHETNYNGRPTEVVNSGTLFGESSALFDLPDVKPGDSGRTRFCFELETSPAYLWLCGELIENAENGLTEPETAVGDTDGAPGNGNGTGKAKNGRNSGGELADAIDVDLKYADAAGNASTTITSGTLREVLSVLSSGVPLDAAESGGVLDAGNQTAFEPGSGSETVVEPCLVFEWAIDESVGNEIQTDSVAFGLTFHAQQARHGDGTNNPCAGDGDEGDDGDDGSDRNAISFGAFCVEDGSISADDVTNITITETKDGGEPLAISWETRRPVDHVVLKTGGGRLAIENFPGGMSGTASVGGGEARRSGQTPNTPCPDGSSVKFNYGGGGFTAE